MALTDQTLPAYITIAFDLDGAVKVVQLQERRIIKDGDTVINNGGEGDLLPIRLIQAPHENDAIEAKLSEALDAATAGSVLRCVALESQLTGALEAQARLRIIVDAFPQTSSGDTASAAEGDPVPTT